MKKELLLLIKSMTIGLFICPVFYLFDLENGLMNAYIVASGTVLGFYYAWTNLKPIFTDLIENLSEI